MCRTQPTETVEREEDSLRRQVKAWLGRKERTRAEREAYWEGMQAMGEPLDMDYMTGLLRLLRLL